MVQQRPQPETRPFTIGVDPHMGSHTAAILDGQLRVLDQVRVASTRAGYRALRQWPRRWPERSGPSTMHAAWAVRSRSGCSATASG